MKGLASFVMRGLSQAVMLTTVLALLSLLLPLVGILSAATVGLVTLRQGANAGARVGLLATLACGLFMAVPSKGKNDGHGPFFVHFRQRGLAHAWTSSRCAGTCALSSVPETSQTTRANH